MGKRTPLDEFTVQHRGGKGLRCYKITDKTGYVVGVKTIKPEEEIYADHYRRYCDSDEE